MAITGQGNASKEQVAFILQRMLKFEEMPENLDATDGLAAAVCHFFQIHTSLQRKAKLKTGKILHQKPGKGCLKLLLKANILKFRHLA